MCPAVVLGGATVRSAAFSIVLFVENQYRAAETDGSRVFQLRLGAARSSYKNIPSGTFFINEFIEMISFICTKTISMPFGGELRLGYAASP